MLIPASQQPHKCVDYSYNLLITLNLNGLNSHFKITVVSVSLIFIEFFHVAVLILCPRHVRCVLEQLNFSSYLLQIKSFKSNE